MSLNTIVRNGSDCKYVDFFTHGIDSNNNNKIWSYFLYTIDLV
jgi:hypothetical protein